MGALTSLGGTSNVNPNVSFTHTTTASVPSGAKVYGLVGWNGSTINLSNFTCGGLTWTIVLSARSGNLDLALVTADAPSGMATSQTATATTSGTGSTGSNYIEMGYGTSIPTGSTAQAQSSNSGSTTAWTSNNIAVVNGDTMVGGGYEADGANTVSTTPSGSNVEVMPEVVIATDSMMVMEYQLPSATGNAAISGTLSTAVPWVALGTTWGSRVGPPLKLIDTSLFPKPVLRNFKL